MIRSGPIVRRLVGHHAPEKSSLEMSFARLSFRGMTLAVGGDLVRDGQNPHGELHPAARPDYARAAGPADGRRRRRLIRHVKQTAPSHSSLRTEALAGWASDQSRDSVAAPQAELLSPLIPRCVLQKRETGL